MGSTHPAEAYLDVPEILGPTLSPEGDHVAFLWNDTGRRELYVASAHGSSNPRRLTDRDLRGWVHGTDYCWQADGGGLYVLQFPRDDPDHASISAVSLDGEWRTLTDVEDTYALWTVTAGGSLVISSVQQSELSIYDPTNDERRPLTEESFRTIRRVRASPDGHYVAFAGFPADDGPPFRTFVVRIDRDDALVPVRSDAEAVVVPVAWHPDDGRLLVHDYTATRYGMYDPATGTIDWLVDAPEADLGFTDDRDLPVGFTPDGEGILVLPDGEPTIVNADIEFDVELSGVVEADIHDRRLAFVTDRSDDAPRLVTLAWPDRRPTPVLETTYGPISPADDVRPEEHTYESSAGETDVLVHHPESEPAPVVVFTYPGDRPTDNFPRWGQYLVHRGYAVVRPAIPRHDTDAEHENLAAVGEWLRDREWVDGDRVAVFGHSAGGEEVLVQLLTRDTWSAGIARAASTDTVPDEVDRLAAPLRIHHPVHDTSARLERVREVRSTLREAGNVERIDFEYAELPDEGHITADVQQNANELTRIVDFLERRL